MHQACMDFVRRVKVAKPEYFAGRDVLEVGSRNVNGTPRLFFRDCRYTGVDAVKGRDVDVVADAMRLPFGDAMYDAVLCLEVFEHAKEWRAILVEMARVAKPGALLVVTCASFARAVHGLDEYGFGHYANVMPNEMREAIDAEPILWEEDRAANDLRAAWIR